jgi:PhnB protein
MGNEAQSAKDQNTAIAPMLSVRNGVRAIKFYKAAFGADELFRIDDESGGAVVARLSPGESEFWLADESPEHGNFSPESLGGGSVRMVMIVKDPDSGFERAVIAGANVVGLSAISHMVGASDESSIPSDTIGKSAGLCPTALEL